MKSTVQRFLFLFVLCLFVVASSWAQRVNYVTSNPKDGEGLDDILKRFALDNGSENVKEFIALNPKKFDKNYGLFLHHKYKLPIKIFRFNGNSIKSSLNIEDSEIAKSIQKYNDLMFKRKIKSKDIISGKEIWVPYMQYDIDFKQASISSDEAVKKSQKSFKQDKEDENLNLISALKDYSIFGDYASNVKIVDKKLKGHVFYLVSGHGGPDPGAIGSRDGYELQEHEYAYDVTLRLAKKLIERSATVYMIVQDANDGIRDEKYLNKCGDERLINGDTISHIQNFRLKQRAEIINQLFDKNKKKAASQQLVEIHVDSRITDQRIDIFFYHKPGSEKGLDMCNELLSTIKAKYDANQPGRGYAGSVKERNLYMLRNTKPIGVYIELGNIQNPRDQFRLIEPNNRQAIANWLCLGLINSLSKKGDKE